MNEYMHKFVLFPDHESLLDDTLLHLAPLKRSRDVSIKTKLIEKMNADYREVVSFVEARVKKSEEIEVKLLSTLLVLKSFVECITKEIRDYNGVFGEIGRSFYTSREWDEYTRDYFDYFYKNSSFGDLLAVFFEKSYFNNDSSSAINQSIVGKNIKVGVFAPKR